MNSSIESILVNVGFSEKEVKVYSALLGVDAATASEIAKRTDVNRTTVYDVLEELIKKGMASTFKKKTRTFFRAADPEHLLQHLDHKKAAMVKQIDKLKQDVVEHLPALLSLQQHTTRPKVFFFEGEQGMREAYEDTLTAKNGILAYANVETMHEGLPDFFPEYYKRRTDAKVHIKAVMPRNKLSLERSGRNREEIRQTKFLSDEHSTFTPEVNVYNNKVLIASWKEKMAVIIESKEYADLHRIIHQIVWNALDNS